MVSLHSSFRRTNPSVQRRLRLFYYSPFHHVNPGFRLHSLLRMEDVEAPWSLYVFPLLFVCHRLLSFRIQMDRVLNINEKNKNEIFLQKKNLHRIKVNARVLHITAAARSYACIFISFPLCLAK